MSKESGITVKKSEDFSKWYDEVCQKAELSDLRYNVKGFIVFRPWATRIMNLMYEILEKELQEKDHVPALFPAVIPESNFHLESKHVEGFAPEVFWITEHGKGEKLEEKLALRPTSETAMYKMYSIWIRSWRDLPLKIYQRCQVWRYEGKATRPFIRSREFHWIEAHDVFATEEGAMNQVKEDMEISKNTLHKEFGIPFIFFQRPEHDKFPGAVHTYAADSLLPDGKVLQQPSTHLLGQNFSKPFNVKFVDKDEKEKYGWQTCYGPCVSRIMASVISIHGDDKGLILPPRIAPIQVIIIPILNDKKNEVLKKCEEVKKELNKESFRVEIDKKEEYTPGWKFNYWELKGVPIRVEIGPNDIKNEQAVVVRRDTGEKTKVREINLSEKVKVTLKEIQQNLIKKADKFFEEHISEAKTMDELKKTIKEKGGLVKVNWCGSTECAEWIKEKTGGGDIRGTRFGKEEKSDNKCIYCGKESNSVVYVGKSY